MKKIAAFIIILILTTVCCVKTKAEISVDLTLEKMTQEEQAKELSHFTIRPLKDKEKSITGIDSISVNSDSTEISLVFKDNRIEIYDTQGQFLYGYRMSYASTIGVEFDDSDSLICIYLVRNNILVKVDRNANILESYRVGNSPDTVAEWRTWLHVTNIESQNKTYSLSGGTGLRGYYRCEIADNNEVHVIYQNSNQILYEKIALWSIALLLLIIAVILCSVFINKKRKN